MLIDNQYLIDNVVAINEEVESIKLMAGVFGLMNESEIQTYGSRLLENGKTNEYIAFSHVHGSVSLNEDMVRHVNSSGETGIRKNRETRSNLAYKTTSLSKAKRMETAIKASKTRSANQSNQTRANRKRRKAKRKRSALGYDS